MRGLALILLGLGVVAATASVQTGCRAENNVVFQNGEKRNQNSVSMRCDVEANGSWKWTVAGCVTPDGIHIAKNSVHQVSGQQTEWLCEISADNTMTLKQMPTRNADCPGGHRRNSRWRDGSFEFECAERGQKKFVACIGANNEYVRDGETRKIQGIDMNCKMYANGTVMFTGLPKTRDAFCIAKDGTNKAHGAEWIESTVFKYKCGDYGVKSILGCEAQSAGLFIPINETRYAGNVQFHCENKNDEYKFYTTVRS